MKGIQVDFCCPFAVLLCTEQVLVFIASLPGSEYRKQVQQSESEKVSSSSHSKWRFSVCLTWYFPNLKYSGKILPCRSVHCILS